MLRLRWIRGLAAGLIAAAVIAALLLFHGGWNWLRGPIEDFVTERTGRTLVIGGDLGLALAWPGLRMRAGRITYANPSWAMEKQMVSADGIELTLDLLQLLRWKIVLPEVRLERPLVFLEKGKDGRKSWLLDRNQADEAAQIRVEHLTLDRGVLGYDDPQSDTALRVQISAGGGQGGVAGVSFAAQGRYKSEVLVASGTGGPVLALRDEKTPYPLRVTARVGRTGIDAKGTVTSLVSLEAADLDLSLRGESLEQLFPLIGIAVPDTRRYAVTGHLVHAGQLWRYEKFSGTVGASDIAGTAELKTGGVRAILKANLRSRVFDLSDIGPLIGAKPGSLKIARHAAQREGPAALRPAAVASPASRVLPDIPFRTDRWSTVDAEVDLDVARIRHPGAFPIQNLVGHLSLRDSVLRLDPLSFGAAGGTLAGAVSLDGRSDPVPARLRLRASGVRIEKLAPASSTGGKGFGAIDGELDLAGKGNSVRQMLAGAGGRVALHVTGGELSRMTMEKAGMHVWEMLLLKMTGDRMVKLRCAVADFDVRQGVMHAGALVFDTEITTLFGTGSIDLRDEKLDLTLNQRTKRTSPLALRSPIRIRGNFANPDLSVDTGRVALRAAGAVVLGVINPFLAFIPLIDAGPGRDSDCPRLVSEARALPRTVVAK